MRMFAIYLFSILLLSTVIARSSSTISIGKTLSNSNGIGVEKTEKIEIEDERTSSDQVKNSEFVYIHQNYFFIEYSCLFVFKHTDGLIPSSYLEKLERPPKKN